MALIYSELTCLFFNLLFYNVVAMLFMHINILVLAGVPGSNIQLELVAAESGQAQYFVLDGNQLRLSQPLDRDADDLSSLVLQVGGLRAVSLKVPSRVQNHPPLL